MSYTQYLKGRAIRTGTEWRLKFTINSTALEAFPVDATFVSQIRATPESTEVLATLTSENGGVTRVSGNQIELYLPADASKNWSSGKVVLDVIRTDAGDDVHLGFDLKIPVKRSVTRIV